MTDSSDQKTSSQNNNDSDSTPNLPNNSQVDSKTQSTQPEITKMAEELGMVRKENETLKEYQERVNPIIDTIWSDPELFKQLDIAYKKRLGIEIKPNIDDEKVVSTSDLDTRDAVISDIVNKFYEKHGINELEEKEKGDINVKVGSLLKDFLDPNNNKKDLATAMKDASLKRLPEFLDRAYFLATKDEMLKNAELKGKKEIEDQSRGIIGGFSSSLIESNNITLSPKEREIADKMGISHEKFLARKKEISKRDNQLFI